MQSLPKQGVSVVIAVYNEIDNIEPLLSEVQQSLSDLEKFEVVVVDDASKDGTFQKLQELLKRYPQLRIVQHKQNYGQSIAVINGVKAAVYDWVITLDGDGQNNPADFALLFTALDNLKTTRPVLVAGIRAKRNDRWIRRISSKIANKIRDSLLKDGCPDSACGLKLFQRKIFLQLPHFNHLHRFLPALYTRADGLIINVPVNHRPRVHGQSKYGTLNRLWIGIIDILGVMWLIRRPCPLETCDGSSP
ncbi:MAG: glycosyltransferase family 2 protein [Proteobacteria bacterium]|nr:glycosyltransferase family 2 protein [Pseudomonadota bacterium]